MHFLFVMRHVLALACTAILSGPAMAQGRCRGETLENLVVVTKLFPPVYPPLARAAHMTGDVKVNVGLRRDGSVSSVEVVGGHPLLKDAALRSAQNSTFNCQNCNEELMSYSFTYTFSLRDIDCGVKRVRSTRCLYLWKCGYQDRTPPRSAEIRQSQGHVTVIADSSCVETQPATLSGG